MNICIVQPLPTQTSETFLRAHAEKLPGNVTVVHGKRACTTNGRIGVREHFKRAPLAVERILRGKQKRWEYTESYRRAFVRLKPEVVIAEYGPMGVHVMDACRQVNVPLVVHFRGYDATHGPTLAAHQESYPKLFRQAGAIVAVSKSIQQKLIDLGADPSKIHYNPSGADCERVQPGDPAKSKPVFLAVGRVVPNKGLHLTLLAFANVLRQCPDARLRIIGSGPLLDFCKQLCTLLRLDHAVTFLGGQPHETVIRELRSARAFVQHSVTDPDGNSEGTPVAVMEAGAAGLPVVSTRHAGIPDVVVEDETGFLVDEHDVTQMAQHMVCLARDPQLAGDLGRLARQRIETKFSQRISLDRLASIIQQCAESGRPKGGQLLTTKATRAA